MKQFLFFAGNQFYPYGGWNDFKASFDTAEQAHDEWIKSTTEKVYDWAHVVDLKSGEEVASYSLRDY